MQAKLRAVEASVWFQVGTCDVKCDVCEAESVEGRHNAAAGERTAAEMRVWDDDDDDDDDDDGGDDDLLPRTTDT